MHRREFISSGVGGSAAALVFGAAAANQSEAADVEVSTTAVAKNTILPDTIGWYQIKAYDEDTTVTTHLQLRNRVVEILQETASSTYGALTEPILRRRLRDRFPDDGPYKLILFGLFKDLSGTIPGKAKMMAVLGFRWRKRPDASPIEIGPRIKMIGLAESHLPLAEKKKRYQRYLREIGFEIQKKLGQVVPNKIVDVVVPPVDDASIANSLAARVRALPRPPVGNSNVPLKIREFSEADGSRTWEIDVPA